MGSTFERAWRFDVAGKVLTSMDLGQLDDPTSEMGKALNDVLTTLVLSGSLPPGGTVGQVVRKLSSAAGDGAWATLTTADVQDLVTELAAKAPQSALDALTTIVTGKATQASVDGLTTSVAGKASQAALDALTTTVAGKATTAAVAALKLGDLADVDGVTLPVDDYAVTWDAETAQFVPTNLSNRFPTADPSTGFLQPSKAAPFTLFGFIVEAGQNPPAGLAEVLGLGVPIIGFQKAAVPSMVPILLHSGFAQAPATGVVLTIPEILPVGTKLLVAVGYSAEATITDNFLLTWSTGASVDVYTPKVALNTTMACVMAEVRITTQVPANATLTITNRSAANAAVQRAHTLAAAFKMPNTAVSALDVNVAPASGASSSTLTAIGTPVTATDTAQVNEVAIGIAAWNSGLGATVRSLDGTNGWTELIELESENATAGRSLAVFYKILTGIGRPQLTTLCTSTDGTTGQFGAQLATFKGAP